MIRVAAFVAALGVVFSAAFGVGRWFPFEAGAEAATAAADGVHGGHGGGGTRTAAEAPLPAGLSVAASGFRLELVSPALSRGTDEIAFRIVDDHGEVLRDYEVVHEKPMHLILARRDLGDFQHLHPVLGGDGVWRATTTFKPGVYRAFADFEARGARAVLGGDFSVDGAFAVRAAPPSRDVTRAGPYTVELDASFAAGREVPAGFTVFRDGRKITPDPYLGARGHLVVLREGDLAYIHAHPREASLDPVFDTALPSAGRYRLYLQFAAGGEIHTAEWALVVA